jgi:hypothetical protein
VRLGTVVHPKAKIISIGGPIVIGSNCIVEEGVVITNRYINLNSIERLAKSAADGKKS